jgi:UDP-hydrolysing UDP-N-acetyl-D-glucosamine 2-epimerase
MRKICVVTANRADYSRVKSVLQAIQLHPSLKLQLVVAGSHLVDHYGMTVNEIEKDGFPVSAKVHIEFYGSEPAVMAKSTGLAVMEFATLFNNLKPDIVLALVDRYENFASAVAAAMMNIPTAHIQGGEVTGTIDESLRHAMTKLSHIHFPATDDARERIIKMGEDPCYVFNVGCPATDILLSAPKWSMKEVTQYLRSEIIKEREWSFNPSHPHFLVIQHPVTTEFGSGIQQIQETLKALLKFNHQVFMLWPNIDAGSDDVSRGIRIFKINNPNFPLFILKHTPHKVFINLLRHASCMIGNSSSGIREACYFGIPVVNIGTRQQERERGKNVLDVGYNSDEIAKAIGEQLEHGSYDSEFVYGDGSAGKKIAEILASVNLSNIIQKKIQY